MADTVSLVAEWEPDELFGYLDAVAEAQGIKNDAELARVTGVNQTQIGNWREGKSRPSMKLLARAAAGLDVPEENLYVLGGWIKPSGPKPKRPDLAVLPREFADLIDLYVGAGGDDRRLILEHLRVSLRGLRGLVAEQAAEPVAQPEPKSRRVS